jgi:spore cortex biosynthesis protein YabQ
MLLFGFFAGLFFRIYQSILHKWKIKRKVIHILDILFSILIGLAGFVLLIFINYGDLRFYIILAIIIGFSISILLFSSGKKTWPG